MQLIAYLDRCILSCIRNSVISTLMITETAWGQIDNLSIVSELKIICRFITNCIDVVYYEKNILFICIEGMSNLRRCISFFFFHVDEWNVMPNSVNQWSKLISFQVFNNKWKYFFMCCTWLHKIVILEKNDNEINLPWQEVYWNNIINVVKYPV